MSNITKFFASKKIAIVGISATTPQKFGNMLFKELSAKPYQLYPVHPDLDNFQGTTCYPSISALPPEITSLIIVTKPEVTINLMKEAISKGINNIWLQQGAENNEIIEFAKNSDANIIYKQCALMFAEPTGSLHKFHRGLKRLFGRLPK